MPLFEPDKAIEALRLAVAADPTTFGTTQQEQNAFLEEARVRLGLVRSPDDHKEASKLAVETAKIILTISAGLLVAVGTFVQFARNQGVPWQSIPMYLFVLAGGLLGLSFIFGLFAMSGIYKRADGRSGPAGPAWGTESVSGRLDWQVYRSGLGLLALVVGLFSWAELGSPIQAAVSVTLPGTQAPLQQAGPVTLEGAWTSLKLRTASNFELNVPAGASPMTIVCK
jgi:hypothetical protein